MKKARLVRTILGILFLTIFTLVFIKYNNDHKECRNEVTTSINSKGEKIEVKKHICKENFNL